MMACHMPNFSSIFYAVVLNYIYSLLFLFFICIFFKFKRMWSIKKHSILWDNRNLYISTNDICGLESMLTFILPKQELFYYFRPSRVRIVSLETIVYTCSGCWRFVLVYRVMKITIIICKKCIICICGYLYSVLATFIPAYITKEIICLY